VTRATAATEMATTTGSMSTTASASMPTTASMPLAALLSRVGGGRQRGRKNNDGNPKFERRHNFLRPVRDFCSPNTLMIITVAWLPGKLEYRYYSEFGSNQGNVGWPYSRECRRPKLITVHYRTSKGGKLCFQS